MHATVKRVAFSHEFPDYERTNDGWFGLVKVQRSMFSVLVTNSYDDAAILYIDANQHPAMRLVKEGDSLKFELNSLFKPSATIQDFRCVNSVEIAGPF
jgi:hypothetical protein